MKRILLLTTAALAMAAAACGSSAGSGAKAGSVKTSSGVVRIGHTSIGPVLVNASGQTLYVFTRDRRGHSNCSGSCLSYWPPLDAGGGTKGALAGSGVTAKLTTLAGGQVAVAGYPLYTFVSDGGPGDTKGERFHSFGGIWYAVSPTGAWIVHPPTHATQSASSSGGSGY